MMNDNDWRPEQARKSLHRILPDIEQKFATDITADSDGFDRFKDRLTREWGRLFTLLHSLYGWQYDFFYTLDQVVHTMMGCWAERPEALRALDREREAEPHWFLSEDVVGGVLYVDLFSDNLAKLGDHIPYFKKLGLTYLHLMPLFSVPRGDNDGGYAVSDYRSVNPDIGTMDELSRLAAALRGEGISLVLDFVFNHTSDDHWWARAAKTGNPDFMAYYCTYPDRGIPDQFEAHTRDIFPTIRRGCFTWCEEINQWVWTTFNSYQWDLNYANPEVFRAMAEEMLFLANQGVEVLRLDAVAFIWKRLGTNCENQPEAHGIIQAFNAMARIVAPCLLFKSEAIVHPDEVIRYLRPDECQLSYNPLLMALLWEALATGEVRLLEHSLRGRHRIPPGCSWVNYIRCHDDIGWTFDDNDARDIGIDPAGHRHFLNQFYTGRLPHSFARGVPFQFNEDTGDVRISGTLSSLAGLEDAIEKQDNGLIEMAVRRINLLRNIQISIGGIPLIYIGDEWGMLNDYSYLTDPAKANDSRWVHRSRKRWETREDLTDQDTLEWRLYHELTKLLNLRKRLPAFRNGGMRLVATGNGHLLGFVRAHNGQKILVVNNFSETPQRMDAHRLSACHFLGDAVDLLTDTVVSSGDDLTIPGLQSVWLDITGQ
jgi:amylosucrase